MSEGGPGENGEQQFPNRLSSEQRQLAMAIMGSSADQPGVNSQSPFMSTFRRAQVGPLFVREIPAGLEEKRYQFELLNGKVSVTVSFEKNDAGQLVMTVRGENQTQPIHRSELVGEDAVLVASGQLEYQLAGMAYNVVHHQLVQCGFREDAERLLAHTVSR